MVNQGWGSHSLHSRIIAAGDAFDAMSPHRPYGNNLSAEEALQERKKSAGPRFDCDPVRMFSHLVGPSGHAAAGEKPRFRVPISIKHDPHIAPPRE